MVKKTMAAMAGLLMVCGAVLVTATAAPEKIAEIVTELGYPATLDAVEALTKNQTFAFQSSRQKARGYGGGSCAGSAPAPATSQCPGSGCGVPPAAADTKTDI